MTILTLISATDTTSLVVAIVITSVIYFSGQQFMKLVGNVEVVHDFAQTHSARHEGLEKDIQRIDTDMKEISTDLRKQITEMNVKLDTFMDEMRDIKNT